MDEDAPTCDMHLAQALAALKDARASLGEADWALSVTAHETAQSTDLLDQGQLIEMFHEVDDLAKRVRALRKKRREVERRARVLAYQASSTPTRDINSDA